MKLFICANGYTQTQNDQALKCIEVLKKLNHQCSTGKNSEDFSVGESDMIVSLGGDGALLKAAKIALQANKPLIGINSGRLGFLCAMSYQEIDNFDEIIKESKLDKRTVIEFDYDNNTYCALNDIIISKSNFGNTVDLNVLTGRYDMEVRGDGLIVSTPTGSTAYNVSAGGPFVDVDSKVLAITPICSHFKDAHPIVISDDKDITIKVNHDDAGVYVDGKFITKINDEIVVRKSDKILNLYVR